MLDLRDPVASGSHLFMCLWAVFATLVMRRLTRTDSGRRWSVTIFGLSTVLLYFASGLYHGLQLPREDLRFYQKLDQSAIYLLIAGTSTPIIAILLTGRFRRWLLWGTWSMAAAGIASMWLLPKAPHSVMVGIYLGMGWLGMAGAWHYYLAIGWRGISWLLAAAGLYTLGAVCELLRWPVIWPGVINAHEVLHLCDMAATYCTFVMIIRYVIVYRPAPASLNTVAAAAAPASALVPEG